MEWATTCCSWLVVNLVSVCFFNLLFSATNDLIFASLSLHESSSCFTLFWLLESFSNCLRKSSIVFVMDANLRALSSLSWIKLPTILWISLCWLFADWSSSARNCLFSCWVATNVSSFDPASRFASSSFSRNRVSSLLSFDISFFRRSFSSFWAPSSASASL